MRYLIILGLVLLFTGCSNQVINQSEKAFVIVEEAYSEKRKLTTEELKEVEGFKDFAADWKTEHLQVDGTDLSKEEQKEADIIHGLEWVISYQEYYEQLDEKELKNYGEKIKKTKELIEGK